MIKSRTKSHVIDTSSLLDNEKKFLDEIEKVLNAYRENVIYHIMDGKQVSQIKHQEKEAKEEINAASDAEEETKTTKLVRFLYPVPKFVGTELEEYGPFAEEDIANLPAEIADLLVGKGKVEEIRGN